jgi:hypothetical protein
MLIVFASLLHFHPMHCTMLLLAHIRSFMLGHMEAELEEPTEQAQFEEFTSLALDQDRPRASHQLSSAFL